MKKRTLALLIVLALVLTAAFALVACDKTVKHKVTFWDGNEKLGTIEVEDGKTVDLTKYSKKDGYTFIGWYEDSTFEGEMFKAETPVKEDIALNGKWQSNTVETDSRIWYVMGNLVNPGWDCPTVKDEETGEWSVVDSLQDAILEQKQGTNEFSIELTMRAGTASKFRFATQLEDKSTWAGADRAQAGIGNIVGFEFAAGNNPNGGDAETLESKRYGNVKKDNAIIFEGGKEYDDSPIMWNIFVTPDSEGVYKFTLTTYPGEDDRNTITWEKVRDVEKLDKTFVPYIAGTMTNWGTDAVPMQEDSVNNMGEGTWKYIFEIDTITETNKAEKFKIINRATGADEWLGDIGDGKLGDPAAEIEINENGTWLVIVDSVSKTYKLEKAAIRVVGTIDGQSWADGSQRGEGYKNNMYVMKQVESATEGVEKYELILEITADHKPTTWGEFNGAAAIKVDCGALGKCIWDCGAGQNGKENIIIETVGFYKVTLELSYGEENARQTNVTVTKLETAPAVTIGGTVYEDLAAAVAAAVNGDVILVHKDLTVNKQIIINKTLTLVLNGNTISNTQDIWNDTDSAFFALIEGGNLTVAGNGKILAKENDCYAIAVWHKDSKLVIEDGEFVGNLHSIYVYAGTAEIKGGKFDLRQLDTDKIAAGGTGHEFTLNLYDANGANGTANIIVTGGSFVEYDPSHSTSEAPEANFVANGYEVKSAEEGEKTVYTVTAAK